MAAAAAPSLNALAYSPAFLFFDGFAVIASITIRNIIIAGAFVRRARGRRCLLPVAPPPLPAADGAAVASAVAVAAPPT